MPVFCQAFFRFFETQRRTQRVLEPCCSGSSTTLFMSVKRFRRRFSPPVRAQVQKEALPWPDLPVRRQALQPASRRCCLRMVRMLFQEVAQNLS